MGRYVALPIQIDAWMWTGDKDALPASEWLTGFYHLDEDDNDDGVLIVYTLDGPARAIPHLHWVAKGTKGERYPIRRDVFAEKYAEYGNGVDT